MHLKIKKNKNILYTIFLVHFFILFQISCTSVADYNKKLDTPISKEKLRADINFVQHKLEKLHPSLYTYISKEHFNNKLDSLRLAIDKPLTSKEFFFLLSPVVASVHQGHMFLSPPFKKIETKEQTRLTKLGFGPLSQFDLEWINYKLYVLKNKSSIKAIVAGAEVISINQVPPQNIYNKYRNTYSSDGYNTTYLSCGFSKRFSTYFTNEMGVNDSLAYVFKQNDSLISCVIHRQVLEKKLKEKTAVSVIPKFKPIKENKKKQRIYGYDPISKSYSKNLSFILKDSSIAILKVKDFSKGNFRKGYKEIFSTLKQKDIKTLILDLRNNPGGRVAEAVELYSYLTDKDFVMLQSAIVTSKTSLWKLGLFDKIPKIIYPFAATFYPFYMGFSTLRTKKNNEAVFSYSLVGSKKRKCNANNFSGKVYVIINGGSFSASCLLASSLKSNKNITFVGEETGGGFNSTVAGLLPILTLPNSKLPLRIGLMDIRTTNQSEVIGHGIYPDKEIIPTLYDKIENKDPEMDWIIKDNNFKNNL
jgi:hypothetical protein